VVTTVTSLTIKTFTDFINIAGSLGSVAVCFILPEMFYLRVYGEGLSAPEKLGCWAIGVFGVVGSSYSIVFSILKLISGDYS
jgi:hypothetical protein